MFEDALGKLGDLQRRLERLDGHNEVPFEEIFSDEFMLRNTDFPSIAAFVEASGYSVTSKEDFAAIPDVEWNEHVGQHTRFTSWDEMIRAAGEKWVTRQLKLD